MDTTERLLAERPRSTLTTRAIARAVDVSDGVLYNYFADKDELVLAAMARRFVRLLTRFEASVPQAGSATVEANLAQLARATFDLHAGALPILGALVSDPELLGRFAHEIHREPVGAAQIVESIARYLDGERELGRVRDVDTRATADLLVGAVAVGVFTTLLGASSRTVLERLPATVNALVRGLEPTS